MARQADGAHAGDRSILVMLFSAPPSLSSKQIFSHRNLGKVNMRDEQIATLAGTVALALIVGALGFQYLGHVVPCEMCHWQRWAHFAAIAVGLGGTLLWKKDFRLLALFAIAFVAISGLIGAYQQGMQWHLLPGPTACTGHRYVMGSNVVPVVQCDIPGWEMFGVSLAGYNALISLATAAASVFMIVKTRK
jgi:disulfide bond formation protein DsbB